MTTGIDIDAELAKQVAAVHALAVAIEAARDQGDIAAMKRLIGRRLDRERDAFQLGYCRGHTVVRRDGRYLYQISPDRFYPIQELIPGA